MRRTPAGLVLAVGALVLATAVAGCAQNGAAKRADGASHPARVTTTAAAPTTTTTSLLPVTDPPVALIGWTPCNGDLQCGNLIVPLSYTDPGNGQTISIAVARHPAEVPADRVGSLVIDPGGPGVSGVDDMSNELGTLTPGLLDDFDIVMFDPRGVDRSDPVTCGEAPGSPPTPLPDPVPTTPSAQSATVASFRQYADACQKASGTVLPYVGTVDSARDMERLRIALGDSALSYMGQSYGTLLGLTYASMFPTHVRAMVLDSVIDPALTLNEITEGQAVGFEASLQSFFSWCAGTSACPWHTGTDPTSTLLAQIASSVANAVPAGGGRTAGAGELYDALLEGLYSQTDWPDLGAALAADAAGNGAQVVTMSDQYNQNGSSNGDDAAVAIDCLDHPTSPDLGAYGYLADLFKASAPVFGPLLAWGEASCAVWPAPPTRPVGPISAPGSPPILVVGTTGDPATPYAWAVNVAHELNHGVLLTRDGVDHVAYFYSACVRGYVQTYFVSGTAPPAGTICAS
ncbi:MAG TPA: alpha/beta hydrolase [Acidimicrobiales bacterium]|nr:alpha/beta hydrolase [Acidimicrobiales bacterium]